MSWWRNLFGGGIRPEETMRLTRRVMDLFAEGKSDEEAERALVSTLHVRAAATAVALALAAFGCADRAREPASSGSTVRADVSRAMERYVGAIRAADPDSMSAYFAPAALLLETGIPPIRTRDSIRAFLAGFAGLRVDSASVVPDTIQVLEGSAIYWGAYFERATFPGQPESSQHGMLVADWIQQDDGTWLMQRLLRVPVPDPGGMTSR